MDKYEQLAIVGEGSYGLVMKCRHRETDQIVAIKKFLETEEDATIRKMALREIRMLKRLKHENLVTMIEVFRHRKRFYLVFEYLERTVLDELDKMPNGLGEEMSRERIFQVTRAIGYCHSNNIVHRDVKPENVLVSTSGVVKLCDFGFARHLTTNDGDARTEYVATRWYRAPELLVGDASYGFGVDVWALGCLLAEMMTGEPLFPGESDIDQLYLIVKMLGKPCSRHLHLISRSSRLKAAIKVPFESTDLRDSFDSWPLEAVGFLHSCIRMDPQERLPADELLRHPYFTHDRFVQRFLPTVRERVAAELERGPLLRRFKTEIMMATDKREEIKKRDFSRMKPPTDPKWKFEGSVKRKLNHEQPMDPSRPTERARHNINKQTTIEMQMLEKSLESLARITKTDVEIPWESPTPFRSLHFNFNHPVLHPSINNISFNGEPPKRATQQVPPPPFTRAKYVNVKKGERNGPEHVWLVGKKKEKKSNNNSNGGKLDDFSLPNLPGATTSPTKTKKKTFLDTDTPEVTPRLQSSTSQKSTSSSQFSNLL